MYKIRWREHELILVTMLMILSIAGSLWKLFDLSPSAMQDIYGKPFTENGLAFSYYKNVLFPYAGILLLVYLCYLRMNLHILPRLFRTGAIDKGTFQLHFSLSGRIEMEGPGGESFKKLLAALLYTLLLALLLGAGWGISYYYQQPFDFFLPGHHNDSRQIILGIGLKNAFGLVTAYILYAALREAAIRSLERENPRREYRVSIANQVSGFLVAYLSLPYFLFAFDINTSYEFYVSYFCFISPVLLVCLCNLYWIFPLKGERSIYKWKVFWRWLLCTFICTAPFVPFALFSDPSVMPAFMIFWTVLQLLITTPLSWLFYRQRKDKILQLRGLEAALGKSTADLQFLRSQINPHFLFNTLNTLYGTALQENAGRTAEGVQKLGDMMRFMLHENNQDFIPMRREIDYLKNYIALQKLRTEPSPSIIIQDEIELREGCCDQPIAPMLLIPFVENAFKHGISLQELSWIKIRLACDEKGVHFEVCNSVHPLREKDPEENKSGIGMKNVVNRLKLLYGGRHDFFVHRDEREYLVQLAIRP